MLTYGYLAAMNLGLVIWPQVLSYDWQMGSVPLIQSLNDSRNLVTLAVLIVIGELLRRIAYTDFRLLLSVSTSMAKENLVEHGSPVHQSHDPRRTSSEDLSTSDSRIDPRSTGNPIVLMGAALLILSWLPASNLFVTVGFVLAERVLYIPSMGFCLLTVEGLRRMTMLLRSGNAFSLTSVSRTQRWNRRQKIIFISLFAFIAFGAIRTIRRNRVWLNRETLFE